MYKLLLLVGLSLSNCAFPDTADSLIPALHESQSLGICVKLVYTFPHGMWQFRPRSCH